MLVDLDEKNLLSCVIDLCHSSSPAISFRRFL
jgi:hypothetical protein